MKDFLKFLKDVFWHWQSWAGGSGFGGAVVVAVNMYERLTGHTMAKRMYVTIFIIVFLFGAFYMAWLDQYRARIAAETGKAEVEKKIEELNTPKLSGRFEGIFGAPLGNQGEDCLLTILAAIQNVGAPSIARLAKLSVMTADGKEISGQSVPIPKELHLYQSGGTYGPHVDFTADDSLVKKVNSQPIPTGGQLSGFLQVIVKGITRAQVFTSGTKIRLAFEDVKGNAGSIEHTMSGTKNDLVDLEKMAEQTKKRR